MLFNSILKENNWTVKYYLWIRLGFNSDAKYVTVTLKGNSNIAWYNKTTFCRVLVALEITIIHTIFHFLSHHYTQSHWSYIYQETTIFTHTHMDNAIEEECDECSKCLTIGNFSLIVCTWFCVHINNDIEQQIIGKNTILQKVIKRKLCFTCIIWIFIKMREYYSLLYLNTQSNKNITDC